MSVKDKACIAREKLDINTDRINSTQAKGGISIPREAVE